MIKESYRNEKQDFTNSYTYLIALTRIFNIKKVILIYHSVLFR